jgi:hypothetical protein
MILLVAIIDKEVGIKRREVISSLLKLPFLRPRPMLLQIVLSIFKRSGSPPFKLIGSYH